MNTTTPISGTNLVSSSLLRTSSSDHQLERKLDRVVNGAGRVVVVGVVSH